MLRSLSFLHYKAFNQGEIELRPLTIILGANNTGKTSLLQIMLLIQQTLTTATTRYKSALRLHDRYVTLGAPETLFHDQCLDKALVFSFGFNSAHLLELLKSRLLNDYIRNIESLERELKRASMLIESPESTLKNQQTPDGNEIDETKDFEQVTALKLRSIALLREKLKDVKDGSEERFVWLLPGRARRRDRISLYSNRDLEGTFYFLLALTRLRLEEFELSFGLNLDEESLFKVSRLTLSNDQQKIIEVVFNSDGEVIELSSDIVSRQHLPAPQSVQKVFNLDKTLWRMISEDEGIGTLLTEVWRTVLSEAVRQLARNFDDNRLFHVGPLRGHPKRFYFLDRANLEYNQGGFIEALKDNSELLSKVNHWLERFQIKVAVSEFRSVIHRLSVTQPNVSADLDITDVGFGISQVLPVIVQGFLAPEGSLTLIEQPETHLHPRMQAELADLFIDMIGGTQVSPSKQLVIETHSEYLLKRLRRRVAEGRIQAKNVILYFISRKNEDSATSIIKRAEMSEKGAFDWPAEFYEDDLEDTIEFLKAL